MPKNNKIVRSTPLVAIDLGTSGVRAMAAEKIQGDILRILGYEESLSRPGYMERGVVMQTSNAGYMIGEVLRKLANRVGEKDLPTAFICTGGKTMTIYPVSSSRDLARRRQITTEILQEMEKECREKIEKNKEVGVLGLVPSYYTLDHKEQDFPPQPNQTATLIETHYYAFVVRREVSDSIYKSCDQSMKIIEASFVRPDALLSVFQASDGETVIQRGCAVLDMGAETTTLTIYKAGQYLTNKVVPLGSDHITRLIAQQGIHPEQAEELKCKYGYASPREVTKRYKLHLTSTFEPYEELCVTSAELSELIEQKLEEILEPVLKILNDYSERIETLYITGGGSMLQGMDHYLQDKLSIRVLYGAHDKLLTRDTSDEYCSPRYSSLIGTLLMASEYRELHKEIPQRPTNILEQFKKGVLDLFTETEMDYSGSEKNIQSTNDK